MTTTTSPDSVLAWHFLRDDRHLEHDRTRTTPVTLGETITVKGPVELCHWGLHASRRLYDALSYARGNVICRVLVGGSIVEGDDKLAGTSRTVIAMIDGRRAICEWGCDCAERALTREREAGRESDARSWAAIEVARRYLRGEATKDELRAAADAAYAAAYAATYAADAAAYAAADAAYAADAAADAADAADAATYAAYAATDAAAYAAEIEWQAAALEQRVLDAMGITADTRVAVTA